MASRAKENVKTAFKTSASGQGKPQRGHAPLAPAPQFSGPPRHDLARWRRLDWLRVAAALGSGALAAAAFPPLGWWPAALVATIPLLLIPYPRRWPARLLIGYLFGYTYFALSLLWLNTVGFGAGFLLALPCACFPAIWYILNGALAWHWKPAEEVGGDCQLNRLSRLPGAATAYLTPCGGLALCAVQAALWVVLEWTRGWIFTGFPWNQLGVAFANCGVLRQLAALGGVWLLSFIAILVSALLADTLLRLIVRREGLRGHGAALALLALAHAFVVGALLRPKPVACWKEKDYPTTIHILAVQADIPECRSWDEAQYEDYFNRIATLTRTGVAAARQAGDTVNYVLWPEGALPPPLTWPRYAADLKALLAEIKAPLLAGVLDVRFNPENLQAPPDIFNTLILLDGADAPVLASPLGDRGQHYDKCHLVPFGEYVPFSKYFPKLADVIGLGRDMAAGRGPLLLRLEDDQGLAHLAGANICFEDAFPEISRRFTCLGAEFLMTVTNDCWYKQSAGAKQHLAHAVMRAVENHRPLLRSGNNSDTCLIQDDGTVCEPVNGGDFGPGWHLYRLYMPARPRRGLTPYARAGAWFPLLCLLACAIAFRKAGSSFLARRAALRQRRLAAK